MEKETKRKNQKRSLIKKVLIGIGIVGVSVLTISILRRKYKQDEYHNMQNALKTVSPERPIEKKVHKTDFNDEAVVRECNSLLEKVWKKGNPDNNLYYDNEVFIDIKSCQFPPYITHEGN